MNIKTGNLLEEVKSFAIIAHLCNDANKFGAGFAKQVAIKYPIVKENYHGNIINQRVGEIQVVKVTNNLIFVNMIAMQGVYSEINRKPLSDYHLRVCLEKLRELSIMLDKPVHMPKIGSGKARGNWDSISNIISEVSSKFTIWELPNGDI